MISETETVLDRRRMRRSVTFWRTLAVFAAALALGAYSLGGDTVSSLTGQKQVARVVVEGTITDSRAQIKMLKKIKEASHVKGLLVFVNSPGGTTSGGEALYDALRDVAKDKPVVAQFGTLAASAGYIVGLAADHIVARGNTITGSVGVIMQWPEVHELLGKIGVKVNEIRSGEMKAMPSPFAPLDEKSRRVTEEMIADSNRWFQGLVESRRGIKVSDVPGLGDGRIYSGREAFRLKLVDELGGEAEAVRWMAEKRGLPKDIKVVDWKPGKEGPLGTGFGVSSFADALVTATADRIAAWAGRTGNSAAAGLDGLVSVWHPGEK